MVGSRAWAVSLAVLLLAVSMALCVSPEDGGVAVLGEASGGATPKELSPGGKAANEAPAKDGGAKGDAKDGAEGEDKAAKDLLLTPWDKQGLGVIKAYANYNKKLQKTEAKLREKLANPPEKVEGIAYHSIPGYKYNYLGRKMTDQSRSQCELLCSSYSACKSYSYNQKARECVWSMGQVKYNEQYTMWIKKVTPEGDHTKLFNDLPGLYIQDKLEPMQRIGGNLDEHDDKVGGEPQGKVDKHISWEECKYECANNPECKTFSYAHSKRDCLMSAVKMHYEPEWTYYEKEQPLGGPSWKQEHKKENDQKEELKAQWIAGSTAKARAESEKQTKVDEKMKETNKEEGDAKGVSQRAEKALNSDKSKCALADAAVTASEKRNEVLMADLEKSNSNVVSMKQKHMAAEKKLKSSKSYEARKKQELKVALFDASELEVKAKGLKEDEEAEKKRNRDFDEHRQKVCGARDMQNAVFKSKEGEFKKKESQAKLLNQGKAVGEAGDEVKQATAKALTLESHERKFKMQIAVKKSTLEGTKKRAEQANTEKAKKQALQEVQQDEEVVHKTVTKGDKVNQSVMQAKEKKNKAKENHKKQEEKENKAENLVKSRKRESDMKLESVRVRKKLKVKKESDAKNEKSSKTLKKEELQQKKSVETKQKGEMSLKALTNDELKKKNALRKEEKTYKDVQKQKESNVKSEKKHKQKIADLKQDEDDAKYKVRNDNLKKRTLAENEAEAKKHAQDADQNAKDTKDKASQDEQKEKAAAVALKKATTEADTKKLMRNELNWKSLTTSSAEKATKADQQKMLAAEDLVQAQARLQAENCVHVCLEGMEVRKQQRMREEAALKKKPGEDDELAKEPDPTPAPAPAADPQPELPTTVGSYARRLLTAIAEAPSKDTRPPDTPEQEAIAKATDARLKEQTAQKKIADSVPVKLAVPRVEPFTYNGCECA